MYLTTYPTIIKEVIFIKARTIVIAIAIYPTTIIIILLIIITITARIITNLIQMLLLETIITITDRSTIIHFRPIILIRITIQMLLITTIEKMTYLILLALNAIKKVILLMHVLIQETQ